MFSKMKALFHKPREINNQQGKPTSYVIDEDPLPKRSKKEILKRAVSLKSIHHDKSKKSKNNKPITRYDIFNSHYGEQFHSKVSVIINREETANFFYYTDASSK
ncbi:hypothetical protein TPHA_0D04205 [Tetrapisispora phaffii CBS 4417]|uniref:Uncharacterized protein n=1 Tax=Tetrapisispora phaffii (strain ATCC 24235 / CBS 4417 / NBRC 1672 / NRRL Y-8282 / UCD 70-5) TaxID=1071381 RepID=G8BRX9_TETPH|nr:hypothetical protein TPHA_0D04205 [Tetrapisispora phaffii CBS 4417]CCE63054.1 hypothetical protein TPHA_0D04205 [Tetrapisispora phaffii CBS 4417]